MMWLSITIAAYFLLALVNLIDKLLIDKVLPSAKLYAALVSLMGGLVILGAPWWLSWPGWYPWFADIFAGALFTVALWLMFEALKYGDASKITVLIGSLIPVFTLLWSLAIKRENFRATEIVGIVLLLLGALVLVVIRDKHQAKVFVHFKFGVLMAVSAALVYAAHFVVIKQVYDAQPFASAFIWRGLGGALAGALLLLGPRLRQEIATVFIKPRVAPRTELKHKGLLVLAAQGCGALGFILQSYAISLKSVVLINALQGAQYVILFGLGALATKLWPRWFQEDLSQLEIAKKTSAILLTALGIILLSWS